MKRVAICMRGGVSTYSSDSLNGGFIKGFITKQDKPYINFNMIHFNIVRHIIQANPTYQFDFFLHCWNTDLKQELEQLYQPKRSLFEENKQYESELLKKCNDISYISGPSQCLSIKKSIELMKQYELQHGIYDVVISYRYDVLLWKNMILDNYDIDKALYCNYMNPIINNMGDFHFVMNSVNALTLSRLYDWISKDNPFVAHSTITLYMKHCGVVFKTDSIINHFHQDLLRLVHYSKIKNHPLITGNDIVQSKKRIYYNNILVLSVGLLFSLCFISFSIKSVFIIFFLYVLLNAIFLIYTDLEYSCSISIIIILIFFIVYKAIIR